jgi:hypothetical protein
MQILEKENSELRIALEAETQKLVDLESKYLALVSGQTDTDAVAEGCCSYLTFRNVVVAKLGKKIGDEQGWRSAFLSACGGKYNEGHVNKWRKANSVPDSVIQEIEAFDFTDRIGHAVWTEEEKAILYGYFVTDADGWVKVVKTHTITDLAAELSEKFGRRIVENSIKSKLNSYRNARKTTAKVNVVVANFPKYEGGEPPMTAVA